MGSSGKMVYERQKLYLEVWQEPVMLVAKRYGISDVMVKKICKRLNVPTPPLGYWAKLKAGKPVVQPPLPMTKGPSVFIGHIHEPKTAGKPVPPLAFLSEASRERALSTCNSIMVAAQLVHPHPLISQDQRARIVERERRQERKRVLATIFGSDELVTPPVPLRGCLLDLRVPDEALDRAYRLLDAAFRTLERLGATIHADGGSRKTVVTLLGHSIRIRMTGAGGQLVLSILEYYSRRKNWRDTPHKRLEQQLGQFVIEIYECAHNLQVIQQEQARAARQRLQDEQRRQEHLRQQQEELARLEALERTANDWHRARIIEAYVAELERHAAVEPHPKEREALQDYIGWAREKIAYLDPIVRRNDPFLGERQVSK